MTYSTFNLRRHARIVAVAVSLLLSPGQSELVAQRGESAHGRPVRIALAAPSVLKGARAQIILRGGRNEIATILLDETSATTTDMLAALARVQSLYARSIAPGLVIRNDVSSTGVVGALRPEHSRRLERILNRVRRTNPARVNGYGMLRWVLMRNTRVDES